MNAPVRILKRNYVDESDCPKWASVGEKNVRIEEDAELLKSFETWQSGECQHEARAIVKEHDAIDRPHFFPYCKKCGIKLGSAVTQESTHGHSVCVEPEKFHARNKAYLAYRKGGLETIAREAAERQGADKRAEYTDYLRSEEWRQKRDLILRRARNTCEGCLAAGADEVHHLTYDHIYQEFCFELVALCADCHRRFHEAA